MGENLQADGVLSLAHIYSQVSLKLRSCPRGLMFGSGVGLRSYSLAFSDSVRSVVSGLLVLMRTQERLKVM